MDPSTEQTLIQQSIQLKQQKSTSTQAGIQTIDTQRYVDDKRFAAEIEHVFQTQPVLLCHSSEIAAPNAVLPVDGLMGKLIVSRDQGGQVHVFHNACRHRGAQLVHAAGCQRRLVCPYHAWSYTTDGKLANIPGESHCFPDLKRDAYRLHEIPCVERYGLIWALPQSQANADRAKLIKELDAFLGPLGSHFTWAQMDQMQTFKKTTKTWNGNWKLFAEGGLETYHFAIAHRNTIAPAFFNNLAVIDTIGDHYRVVMPTRELDSGEHTSLRDCSHVLFYCLPNAAFLVQHQHVDLIQFKPISAHQTNISVTTLIPADVDLTDPSNHNHWSKNHHITNKTLDEDWSLGVSIHQTIQSAAIDQLTFGQNEWALGHFNRKLDELINSSSHRL